jgi:uncharacterized membrane protein YphA (DoxX/SURF4 family)
MFGSKKGANLLLRLAVGFPFLYAAIDGYLHPNDWVGFLPQFLSQFAPLTTILLFFSVFELILGLSLIFGWHIRISAFIAALTYAGIIFTNPSQFLITFRDVGLFFASLALMIMPS